MTEHHSIDQHIIFSEDGSRPTIRVWTQVHNGHLKVTQSTSWITLDDSELHALVNAIAELRPDVLVDAPDDTPEHTSHTKRRIESD